MATLDYAFIADFAKVEANGTLTAVSASWTNVQVADFPTVHRMAVAGRVRGLLSESPIPVRIELSAPDGSILVGVDFVLEVTSKTAPYCEDRVGHLFAMDTALLLVEAGVYQVLVHLDGALVRTLKFEAAQNAP